MNPERLQELEQDPRLTAYVLGELEDQERGEIEALVASDPDVAQYVEELRGVAGAFASGFELDARAEQADLHLLPEQRQRIDDAVDGLAGGGHKGRHPIWSTRGMAAVAMAAGVVLTATVLYQTRFQGRDAMDVARAPAPSSKAPSRRAETEGLRTLSYSAPGSQALERQRSLEDRAQLEALGYSVGLEEEEEPLDSSEWRPVLSEFSNGEIIVKREPKYDQGDQEDPYDELKDWLRDASERMEEADKEAPNREGYRPIHENDFLDAKASPLSTFAVDVDTASYTNVRRMLRENRLPPPDAVRIEELVNYFPYADPVPEPGSVHPIAVHAETTSAPWRPEHRLVRIALTTRPIAVEERRPSNLVFLLDVSGSMNQPEKLPLLKRAFSLLVRQLDERDRVAIVVYAGAAGVVLEPTTGNQQGRILEALERLEAGGSTNGGAGIRLAYDLARQHFLEEGVNRVLLATDGDFNVGVSDDGSLVRMIREEAATGVFLTLLGFGRGNLQDAKMEQIADSGNGTYGYIDSVLEARRLLVEQLGATLEVVGKDVKLQVEFNPNTVAGYRLLGYENRLLAAQDFADDSKDGGEMGAGHRMTALYEVVPAGRPLPGPEQPNLKYQGERQPTGEAFSGELLTVNVRYKRPAADTSVPFSVAVQDSNEPFAQASEDTRFAAAVASFAMLLRGSKYAGDATLEQTLEWARQALGEDVGGYRSEFLSLIARALEIER